MTTPEECPLSELPVDQCGCERHRGKPERMIAPPLARRETLRSGPPPAAIPAKFPGFCPACRTSIEEGDPIARDSEDRWVHDDCVD